MADLNDYRKDIVEACETLVRSGIMTRSYHGNVSLRLPGTDTFLLTAGGSLENVKKKSIALFDLKGKLVEGTVMPTGAEIIQMHAIVYKTRPEMGGVVHTHSPFATGFAVASRSIPPAYEAMVRNGFVEGIPVAKYGPRGSEQSVTNIETVLKEHNRIGALLLENHGVLAFGDSVDRAVRANMTVEESAEIMLNAFKLGGPKSIPAELINATQERAATFAAAGTYSANGQPES